MLELVRRYTATKVGVRESTKAGYQTTINFLEKDPFGQRRIDSIKISDAKLWLISLQQSRAECADTPGAAGIGRSHHPQCLWQRWLLQGLCRYVRIFLAG